MLGQKIKLLREEKGLAQRQVASYINVDPAYISKVERNEKLIGKERLYQLSKLFNTPVSDLLPLWLADNILSITQTAECGIQSLTLALKKLKHAKPEPKR
jgi:transcriptional regulator with XRE-family HTH domain